MSITITRLSKSYGTHEAVSDVSVTIAANELFAIVGESGCGKSTLLRLIAGLETPSAGEIRLGDRLVSGDGVFLPPEAREVGFVFQSYALWPHLTVQGNVAFPMEAKGQSRKIAAQAAQAHLETVSLSPLAERKPAALSGGQRQRVALARCLAGGAQTVLMDEPLANLDPHLRDVMERELLRFHQTSGSTTVYITHDQREAMAMADRMAVMRHGRFLQVGTPQEIHDHPANAEVAHFIGQGSLQAVHYDSGHAEFAGVRVPVMAIPEQRSGPAQALFRPGDITLDPAGALRGTVQNVTYRGAVWEAELCLPDLEAPLQISTDQRLRQGEQVTARITGGWVLPG